MYIFPEPCNPIGPSTGIPSNPAYGPAPLPFPSALDPTYRPMNPPSPFESALNPFYGPLNVPSPFEFYTNPDYKPKKPAPKPWSVFTDPDEAHRRFLEKQREIQLKRFNEDEKRKASECTAGGGVYKDGGCQPPATPPSNPGGGGGQTPGTPPGTTPGATPPDTSHPGPEPPDPPDPGTTPDDGTTGHVDVGPIVPCSPVWTPDGDVPPDWDPVKPSCSPM